MGRVELRALRARTVGIPGLDVEVRHLPAVAHEEGAPIFQPAIEVHDRAARFDAVRRLEDEPAERQALSLTGAVGSGLAFGLNRFSTQARPDPGKPRALCREALLLRRAERTRRT